MPKIARSARGQSVDFDLLAIKQQLANRPAPITVNQRRQFIDERDGVKRESYIVNPPAAPVAAVNALEVEAASARNRAEALASSLIPE